MPSIAPFPRRTATSGGHPLSIRIINYVKFVVHPTKFPKSRGQQQPDRIGGQNGE